MKMYKKVEKIENHEKKMLRKLKMSEKIGEKIENHESIGFLWKCPKKLKNTIENHEKIEEKI